MRAARLLSPLLLCSFGCSLATNLDTLSSGAGRKDGSAQDGSEVESPPGDGSLEFDSGVLAARGVDSGASDGISGDHDGGTLNDAAPVAGDAGGADAPTPWMDAVTLVDMGQGGAGDGGSAAADGGGADSASGAADGSSSDAGGDAPAMCRLTPIRSATLQLFTGISAITGCGYTRTTVARYVAAVDATTFAAAAACGACMRIETPAAVVEAEVVDQGPSKTAANATSVAVNMAALALLVPDGSTYVDQGVEWRFVPCSLPDETGMTYLIQPGSNASYAALLIQNHRFPIETVEYRISGVYRRLTRTSYNYWVASNGMGGGPFTLRITDVFGHVVEQGGVPLVAGVWFRGTAQFPPCKADN